MNGAFASREPGRDRALLDVQGIVSRSSASDFEYTMDSSMLQKP